MKSSLIDSDFEGDLTLLLEAINLKYDYDFRLYALNSLRRTVVRAMQRMGCHTLTHLRERILQDEESFAELIQSLTIPVTELFRDPAYFLALREAVCPVLHTYPSLKIWVAGCSTGEEVYSLAIILHEEGLLERTTIYATDINARSLGKAAKGTFQLEEVESATQSYLSSGGKRAFIDYYVVDANAAVFASDLRANITFTDHSLVTDAVFSEMHLISCRNVMIYFNRELQERVFGLFHESLCRRCFLGLGSNETIHFSSYAQFFEHTDKKVRLFRKK